MSNKHFSLSILATKSCLRRSSSKKSKRVSTFKKISPADWQASPWKNGGGSTIQLAIFPETSQLKEGGFLWRVSLANISQSGPFSVFPDYDRGLVQLNGGEIDLVINPHTGTYDNSDSLSQEDESISEFDVVSDADSNSQSESEIELGSDRVISLERLVPVTFSGEDKIQCELYGNSAVDLNVMVKRGEATFAMDFFKLRFGEVLQAATNLSVLVFCVDGRVKLGNSTPNSASNPKAENLGLVETSSPEIFLGADECGIFTCAETADPRSGYFPAILIEGLSPSAKLVIINLKRRVE